MKIAIAGFGKEGQANLTYFQERFSDAEFTIFDEQTIDQTTQKQLIQNDVPINIQTGQNIFAQIAPTEFDLVLRSAGVAPYKFTQFAPDDFTARCAFADGIQRTKIWSGTREFFARCPAPIIGVTGTKGKGTTCSMIDAILRADDRTTHLVGNIGLPAVTELSKIQPSDLVVDEMSSFQLWDLDQSPHIAVVLQIEPDHLNVHEDFASYIDAKRHIRTYQTDQDFCVYHPTNRYSREVATSNVHGQIMRYAAADDGGVFIKNDAFYQKTSDGKEHKICSASVMQVPGAHNIENACAALTVAKILQVSDTACAQGLRDFKGLPHHIEFVRELNGVKYYDDSFSSAPSATVAGIKSFTAPEVVIMGGTDKGADPHVLAETLREHNIRAVLLIGTIRAKLAKFLRDAEIGAPVEISDATTMPEIVARAQALAQPGDVVLLSPAHASFDMFKNFVDRGEQFQTEVRKLS